MTSLQSPQPSEGPTGAGAPCPAWRPRSAMVLAAGLGLRMRPLTDHLPKPLIPLAGRPLIDHVLDRLASAGVERAVVNTHYCADALCAHLAARMATGALPAIVVSSERELLLDTGGGVKKALGSLGSAPFFVHNSDSVWLEDDGDRNLERMITAWDGTRMDGLLLLAPVAASLGYGGAGDFLMGQDGRLKWREGDAAPHVFAGVSIIHPRLLDGAPEGPFSLLGPFDRALAAGRLFGVVHRGLWMHVGSPEALVEAEKRIQDKSCP